MFSELAGAERKTGAVALSWWSELFHRMPFDPVRDIELDSPQGPIHHGRFHTMADATDANQMSPSDADLFATLTYLCEAKGIDYGLLHTSTLDSMGHGFGHGKREMSDACYYLDAALAPYVTRWRNLGYDVIKTQIMVRMTLATTVVPGRINRTPPSITSVTVPCRLKTHRWTNWHLRRRY